MQEMSVLFTNKIARVLAEDPLITRASLNKIVISWVSIQDQSAIYRSIFSLVMYYLYM